MAKDRGIVELRSLWTGAWKTYGTFFCGRTEGRVFECVHGEIYTPVCHAFQYQSFKDLGASLVSDDEEGFLQISVMSALTIMLVDVYMK